MKAINYFLVLAMSLLFFACTNSEDENMVDGKILSFEAMKSLYGIEVASLNDTDVKEVPLVTLEEMQSVLEALRKNSNTLIHCKVVDSEGNFGATKAVQMVADYQARSRSGSLLENFSLCVSLKFTTDKGQVFYTGTDYVYRSDLFSWNANGLSLAPMKNSGYYGFESTSYLYFRIIENNNQIVKVQLTFGGKYNFVSSDGDYSFGLSNCGK